MKHRLQFSNFERDLFKRGNSFEKQLKQALLDHSRNLTAIGNVLLKLRAFNLIHTLPRISSSSILVV